MIFSPGQNTNGHSLSGRILVTTDPTIFARRGGSPCLSVRRSGTTPGTMQFLPSPRRSDLCSSKAGVVPAKQNPNATGLGEVAPFLHLQETRPAPLLALRSIAELGHPHALLITEVLD